MPYGHSQTDWNQMKRIAKGIGYLSSKPNIYRDTHNLIKKGLTKGAEKGKQQVEKGTKIAGKKIKQAKATPEGQVLEAGLNLYQKINKRNRYRKKHPIKVPQILSNKGLKKLKYAE